MEFPSPRLAVCLLVCLVAVAACGPGGSNQQTEPTAAPTATQAETTAAPTETPSAEPTTFDLTGAVVLTSAGVADVDYVVCVFKASGLDEMAACRTKVGEKCSGDKSNLEMTKGAEVLVKDASGEIVGVGALKQGVITKSTSPIDDGYYVCSFRFAVPDITDTGDLYQAEVAGRQPKTFRKADASALLIAFNEA